MRRHRAVARIILFFSIANFTFTGAQSPTMDGMRVNLVTGPEEMTEASERGHAQSEELPQWLEKTSTAGHLHSRVDPIPAQSFDDVTLSTDPEDPEKNKFFNKEVIRKMKEYLVLGSIAGVFIGISNGMQKEITGTVSPGAQTVGRSVESLNEHPRDQEDPASRSFSDLRDEDLQMLSIISRRMLNSLD